MKFGIVDFNIWKDTPDPDFIDINIRSNVRHAWLSFDRVILGKHKDSIIKPINKYVEELYPAPVLVSVDSEKVVLQQRNHAEIIAGYKDGSFTSVDKPHIRQYYNSNEEHSIPDYCFPKIFKAYLPWIIDEEVEVSFETAENSPFFIYPTVHVFNKVDRDSIYYKPPMIPFSFKKIGDHMTNGKTYGKILIGSPMFNIVIKSNEEITRKIKSFYEEA